jgi:hypothetical protein
MFDAVVAWGLIFLLSPEEQRRLLQRVGHILARGGRLLFTSCAEPLVWNDAMTGLESRSLGAEEYRRQLLAVGVAVRCAASTMTKVEITILMLQGPTTTNRLAEPGARVPVSRPPRRSNK